MKNIGKHIIYLLVILCISGSALATIETTEKLWIQVPDHSLHLDTHDNTTRLEMQDYGTMNIPGKPRLPSRIFAVAVPPGAAIHNVEIHSGTVEQVPGRHSIDPVDLYLPLINLSEEELARYEAEYHANMEEVYSRSAFWPESPGWLLGEAGFRKYRLADIQINPVQYNPVTRELIHHKDIHILIEYTVTDFDTAITDSSSAMEQRAGQFILNYDQAKNWYPVDIPESGRDTYDLVVITTAALVDSITELVDFETNVKGRSVYVITVEEIEILVAGVDLPQKMRNFLRERYPTAVWGIEDVLLVGYYDDVPMRIVSQNMGYGRPKTDFYYAELSAPDNVNWDSNGNGRYWEDNDNADYYSEINVGRIPWSTPSIVADICQKSINFELNKNPAYKNNALLLGSFFWSDTDNAVLMEQIMNRPQMHNWSAVRMYEKNSTVYSSYPCDYPLIRSNVQDVWPDGQFAFTNMAGHGSYSGIYQMGYGSDSFWTSALCSTLSNDYPSIIFSVACSNSDTDYDNFGQYMLKDGAVGFVGATKVAYGSRNWSSPSDGSSQSLDYYFSDAVTSTDYTQGAAHQYGLVRNYQLNGWYYDKYEIAEWNLWGNPSLGLDYEDPTPTPPPTQTPVPTWTPIPTSTPTPLPTQTPIPTHTPIPTYTPVPTWTQAPDTPTANPTHTQMPTSTPQSPTATPPEPTSTPKPPTSTPSDPTSTPQVPTATPAPPTSTPPEPTSTPPQPTSTAQPPTETPPVSTETPQVPTETPVHTRTPYPTQPPGADVTLRVLMPSDFYRPGDPCECAIIIDNKGPMALKNLALFAVLDIQGEFFCMPDVNQFSYYPVDLPPGQAIQIVLPHFIWPDSCGSATHIKWYAGITDIAFSKVISNIDTFVFGWSE
jgi:hypothetical protein